MTSVAQSRPDGLSHSGGRDDVDDLIYHISHDLQAPLRALQELPVWIDEDLAAAGVDTPEQVVECLALMKTQSARLQMFLRDLLAFSRVGRKQQMLEIRLADVCDAALDGLQIPPGFTVQVDLGDATVRGGVNDMTALFRELIENGVKHHDRAFGRIDVSCRADGDGLLIEVRDDGPGIDAELRERAFDIMTTLQQRDEREGSGMGLALVRKIARVYGGEAWIEQLNGQRDCSVNVALPARRR